MGLPKFVAFNSLTNIKFLCPSGPNSNIKFDAMVVGSDGVKHEIEKAESDSELVHIKCCETRKYWRGWGVQNNIIVAQANQPEEDIAKEACTLFMHSHKTKDGVTVVNLQYGYRGLWRPICVGNECLVAGQTNSSPEDFIISDLESLTPEQAEERALSIGKTTLGNVSIEDGGLMGITEIGGEVSVDKTYTGRGASIGSLSIGSGSRIRGTPTIGKVSIGGGVSIGKSTPKVEQGRKVRPAVQKKKASK
jgi:hypothetical protein